jgi:hypothetical protein
VSKWVEDDEEDNDDGPHWKNMGFITIDLTTTERTQEYELALDTLYSHVRTSHSNRPFFVWPGEEQDAPLQSPETFLCRLVYLYTRHRYEWAHLSVTPGLDYHIIDEWFPRCFSGNVKLPSSHTGSTDQAHDTGPEPHNFADQSNASKSSISATQIVTSKRSNSAVQIPTLERTESARQHKNSPLSPSLSPPTTNHENPSKRAKISTVTASHTHVSKTLGLTFPYTRRESSPSTTTSVMNLFHTSILSHEQESFKNPYGLSSTHKPQQESIAHPHLNPHLSKQHQYTEKLPASPLMDRSTPKSIKELTTASAETTSIAHDSELSANRSAQPPEGLGFIHIPAPTHDAAPLYDTGAAQPPSSGSALSPKAAIINAKESNILVKNQGQMVDTAKKNVIEAKHNLTIDFGTNVSKSELRALTHFPTLKLTLADLERLNGDGRANDCLVDAIISLVQPAFPPNVHVLPTTGLEGCMPGGAFSGSRIPSTWNISPQTNKILFVRNPPLSDHWVLCALTVDDGVLSASIYDSWPREDDAFDRNLLDGLIYVWTFLSRQRGTPFAQTMWTPQDCMSKKPCRKQAGSTKTRQAADCGFWAVTNLAHVALERDIESIIDEPIASRRLAGWRLRGVIAYGIAMCAGFNGQLKPAEVAHIILEALFSSDVPQYSRLSHRPDHRT